MHPTANWCVVVVVVGEGVPCTHWAGYGALRAGTSISRERPRPHSQQAGVWVSRPISRVPVALVARSAGICARQDLDLAASAAQKPPRSTRKHTRTHTSTSALLRLPPTRIQSSAELKRGVHETPSPKDGLVHVRSTDSVAEGGSRQVQRLGAARVARSSEERLLGGGKEWLRPRSHLGSSRAELRGGLVEGLVEV